MIALDSQSYTYLISAIESVQEPKDSLAEQKISLIRMFFYLTDTFYISPTVVDEYNEIKNNHERNQHKSFSDTLFPEFYPKPDAKKVESLTKKIKALGIDLNDSKIIAECLVFGADVLLSYDSKLLKKASDIKDIRVMPPSKYWESLNIPKNSRPDKIPHSSNPLSNENWWRW
ncbi:MAG: hypothetical protein WBK77_03370 [Alphaproteobacteria bacterium]